MLNVTAGQQTSGIDFHLVPGRTARVTGAVLNANGEPQAGQQVYLSEIGRTVGGALMYSYKIGPGNQTIAVG
jgi:hypothetical protein